MRWEIRWEKLSSIISIVIISAFLASCQLWQSLPVILDITPGEGSVYGNPTNVTTVRILFSRDMNSQTTEGAFTLKRIGSDPRDLETVSGSFRWDEPNHRELRFIPNETLKYGRFRLELSENAEDSSGVNVESDTNVVFMIGEDTEQPYLISSKPVNGLTNISTNAVLELLFSEPVNREGIYDQITVSPEHRFVIEFDSNDTFLRLLPVDPWEEGAYILSVENLEDRFDNALVSNVSVSFKVGTDWIPPVLLSVQAFPSGQTLSNGQMMSIDKFDRIEFAFSEPMAMDLFSSEIDITPSVSGTWTRDSNVLIFQPSRSWDIYTPVLIEVPENLQDEAGHQLNASWTGYACAAYGDSHTLLFECYAPDLSLWSLSDLNRVESQPEMNVELRFNSPVIFTSLLKSLSISWISGSGDSDVKLTAITLGTNAYPDDTVIMTFKEVDAYNLYKIQIKGGREGVLDQYSNWVEEDCLVYFQTITN